MELAAARRLWAVRQGVGRLDDCQPEVIVRRSGYLRSLGGTDIFFALLARSIGLRVADVAAAPLRVAPAVRGCMYLVPTGDLSLLFALAYPEYLKRTERELLKAGSSLDEVEILAAHAQNALSAGAATSVELRKRLPEGSIRSFGSDGKKVGLSSGLPTALRLLELRGIVERRAIELDADRYRWSVRAQPVAVELGPISELLAKLAGRFLSWAAPARLEDFASWAGCSKRAARQALSDAGGCKVTVEGFAELAWDLADETRPIVDSAPRLLPFADNLIALHGGPAALVDPRFHDVCVPQWGRKALAPLGQIAHMHMRPIVASGEVVGFWEFNPESSEVVTGVLGGRRIAGLDEEAERIRAFIVDQCGHARSFSLDTDAKLSQRAELVRGIH